MKTPQMKLIVSATLTALAVAYGPAAQAQTIYDGDDGALMLRNVSRTPAKPTEFANVQMAKFYVPAQWNTGELYGPVGISYTTPAPNFATIFTRNQAKPLVAAFNDGPVLRDPEWTNPVTGVVTDTAFAGHGKRDAWSGLSYDDGATWRQINHSNSGATPVPVFVVDHNGDFVCDAGSGGGGKVTTPTFDKCDYFIYGDDPTKSVGVTPHLVEEITEGGGDVTNLSQALVGNNIFVAWVSRLCTGGDTPLNKITAGDNPYGILGVQRYADYALMKAEGEIGIDQLMAIRDIGKVPFSCLWTKRGIIQTDPVTRFTSVKWFGAERLTTGTRDAYKIEVAGTENAGFAVVWQEDPEGLLPGSGEGPGEGWSGSTVNHKTDIWYSFVPLSKFNTPGSVMSLPIPITDNAKCPINSGETSKQWCYNSSEYDPVNFTWVPGKDLCKDGDLIYNSCITEEARYMEGQTGASRARINLQAYCVGENDVTKWGQCTNWSAWAGIIYEESKGKGDLVDEHGKTLEIGKNIRYHSFEFQHPEPVRQGLQLNGPTKRWPGFNETASYIYNSGLIEFAPDAVNPALGLYDDYIVYRPNIFELSIWNAPLFDTEIARRGALTSQGVRAAVGSQSNTALLGIYKQGIMNQGGPADIMIRRFVTADADPADTTFNPGFDNPLKTLDCARWATPQELGVFNYVTADTVVIQENLPNPNYLDGLCLEPATNVSATVPTTCDGNSVADATGAACGYKTVNPNLEIPYAPYLRTFTWVQPQSADPGANPDSAHTLDDESWHNPWDVAKGHRGILDGDFVMMQYAWAPNWKPNVIGRDTYNLYIRRSFDGGKTYTTTPAALNGTDPDGTAVGADAPLVVADGTTTCEIYRVPVDGDPEGGPAGVTVKLPAECTPYAAGAFEPARNLSLVNTKVASTYAYPSKTVLDPRYTPTGGLLKHASTAFTLSGMTIVPQAPYTTVDPSGKPVGRDLRDPSKFFIAYDDGDNTTVDFGEAEPVNMYYTQASNWGDDYTGTTVTTPTGTYPRLQLLNNLGTYASESSISGSPDGSFLYSIWNQWQWTDPINYEGEINEDAFHRRVLFLINQ